MYSRFVREKVQKGLASHFMGNFGNEVLFDKFRQELESALDPFLAELKTGNRSYFLKMEEFRTHVFVIRSETIKGFWAEQNAD